MDHLTTQAHEQSSVTPAPSLPYVVECKSFAKFFEPIAAFNCIEAAQAYRTECAKVNRIFQYRINSHYEG
jgi:hypothetical protein